jgi:hypothetical protein
MERKIARDDRPDEVIGRPCPERDLGAAHPLMLVARADAASAHVESGPAIRLG